MKAPAVKSVRCAIWTRNTMPPPPISKARPMPAGPWSGPAMTTADTPAGPPTGRTFKNCWTISGPED
jgi:hypothetical protein